MRRQPKPRRRLAAAFCVLGALAGAAATAPAASAANRPLVTSFVDADIFYDMTTIADGARVVRSTGARALRFYVDWSATVPYRKPAHFAASDPSDPAYDWRRLDKQITEAKNNGLEPILSIATAPRWATGSGEGRPGTVRPSPTAFGKFARAIARRYSGSYQGLPRVRYFQAWNEPNYWRHLGPQYDTPLSKPVTPESRLISPGIYRPLVNAFAESVHKVHRDNLVIAGGLAPFGNERAGMHVARVMPFMRRLLCLNDRDRPDPTCKKRIHFDVWSHHPYTYGGPTHKNITPLDVSLGDLPRMRRALMRAVRAGTVRSNHKVGFWATEFSWDTDPPDPRAVPMELHVRWVAEALYRMWKTGITHVTWFQLQDHPGVTGDGHSFESGLFFDDCDGGITCASPKPSMYAFAFPFVAFGNDRGVRVWGRTYDSAAGDVAIEHLKDGEWRQVAVLRANSVGIFNKQLRQRRRGYMRATVVRDGATQTSMPFSLKRVPDREVRPFG